MSDKLIVLELDGATWTVADRLIAAGRLPHLARVKQHGAWGVLRSLEPMISPALWTTIYTGKMPAEHGIQSFGSTARSLRCPRLWDILDQAGFSVGVLGSLATWPPRPVRDGFIVPDYIMALDSQTWPPGLAHLQQIAPGARLDRGQTWRYAGLAWRLLRTGVHPARLLRSSLLLLQGALERARPLNTFWRKVLAIESIRADAFFHLYRRYRPRFAAYHYHAIDAIGHFYWPYYEPASFDAPPPERDVKRYQQAIPQAYVQADALLGRLLDIMDQHTTLVLVSDHGQAAQPALSLQPSLDLPALVQFLGIQRDVLPIRIADQHYLHFQNPGRVQQTEQLLREAFIGTTRRPVFHEVARVDQCLCFALAPGALDKDAHIVFPGYGQISPRALQMHQGPPVASAHTLDGLVALYGRDVRPGQTLDNASILDVTPTMLALFGLPLARDMPGRAWWEALTLDRARTETFVDAYQLTSPGSPSPLTPQEQAILQERLRDLGYL
jgi:arylsulfatase A-like enzyme